VELTFASLLLGWLLFSAGLGLSLSDVRATVARPLLLVAGLAANVGVPLMFLGALALIILPWMASDQQSAFLTGLAVVAAVPIASSSTAWSQNANGNLALSLGLLLSSTILSPFTTPLVLHFANRLGSDPSANVIRHLSPAYTASFLFSLVLVPILLGILTRWMVGPERIAPIQSGLKLANLACLLLLNYSNAALSLPQVVVGTDDFFLFLVIGITGLMCVTAFAGAWLVARMMRADASQRTALLFGLGMNNNGVGLVLASLAVAADTRILLPIIFYNLWQHLVAGAVDHWVCRAERG
jgi:BASS family bile acid:Na+ symporter